LLKPLVTLYPDTEIDPIFKYDYHEVEMALPEKKFASGRR
jgi:carbonic anhydrase